MGQLNWICVYPQCHLDDENHPWSNSEGWLEKEVGKYGLIKDTGTYPNLSAVVLVIEDPASSSLRPIIFDSSNAGRTPHYPFHSLFLWRVLGKVISLSCWGHRSPHWTSNYRQKHHLVCSSFPRSWFPSGLLEKLDREQVSPCPPWCSADAKAYEEMVKVVATRVTVNFTVIDKKSWQARPNRVRIGWTTGLLDIDIKE